MKLLELSDEKNKESIRVSGAILKKQELKIKKIVTTKEINSMQQATPTKYTKPRELYNNKPNKS